MTIEIAIPIAIKKKPVVVLKKILKVSVPIIKISIATMVFFYQSDQLALARSRKNRSSLAGFARSPCSFTEHKFKMAQTRKTATEMKKISS